MPDLEMELTRSRDDRRRFDLEGAGSIRLGPWYRGGATILAGDEVLEVERRGILRRTIEALDPAGAVVGRFGPQGGKRGGPLWWDGRELALRPSSFWRERYALVDGDRDLALLDGKGWGSRPVRIRLDDPATEPSLLLFAAYVVDRLADDAGSSAGATAAATGAV
ncbi:MAG: hypothetical protein AB7O78_05480 [Thermoleophilia bacterium]